MRRLLGILLLARFASSQGITDSVNPFEGNDALLKESRGPAWLKEGMRLSYEVSTSTVAPENMQGNLPTVSAATGLWHMDVVSTARGAVAIVSELHLKDTTIGGAWSFVGGGTEIGVRGYGAGVWVDPAFLLRWVKGLPKEGPYSATIAEMEVGRQKMQVVAISLGGKAQDTARLHFYYAVETGILVQFARSVKQRGAWAPATFTRFLGLRERKLPWAMGRPPSWIFRVKRLVYTGQRILQMPGLPEYAIPIESRNDVRQAAGNVFLVDNAITAGGQGGAPTLLASGPTQWGGLWLPPLALRNLRPGIVDKDELTSTTYRVANVGRTNYGRDVVTLVAESPTFELWHDYQIDNGALLLVTLRDKAHHTTIWAQLSAKE